LLITPHKVTSLQLENEHVLITGATGFVGSVLIKRLLQGNGRLTATVLKGEDIGHLPTVIKWVPVQPLSESSDYSTALQHVDIVIHLAARVHIMHDRAIDPLQEFRRANLQGTERLARQAAQAGVKRFVFISTVKVHGEETTTPYREDSPLTPLDPYGISKAEAETMLRHIAEETGLEVVIVRPPLAYGPGVKANFLQLMKVVSYGVPLPFDSIRNRRSLIFVENLVDALTCCAIHPKAAGQAYLVSDGEDVSTAELIRRIAHALGKPARLFPFSLDVMRLAGKVLGKSSALDRVLSSLMVDTSKIRSELGWRAPFTMDQGLKKTAEWFLKDSVKL
jgi:nucleoside-diphosphate-sugar epimerase